MNKSAFMIIDSYKHLGGKHPETATLKNILACLGVKAPHTGKPFTEEMLLGIGGGLGMGYILWEFKKYASAILVMAFQNQWQYPVKFLTTLCKRLGVKPAFKETAGERAAENHLKEALNDGIPAIAWVDQFHLPYLFFPESYNGCFGWMVTAYGIDENHRVLIDDLSNKPLTLSTEEFAAARGRISSYKNRLLLVETSKEIDLQNAVIEGIRDCINHLSQKSDSFSLPAIAKWAKLMTEAKNPKGWPTVFKKRNGLYGTLKSVYEGIEHKGTGGGAMRLMYADFLTEASSVIQKPALKEVAAQYKNLAKQWTALAHSCLPDGVAPFKETKALVDQKYALLKKKGDEGLKEVQKISDTLDDLESKINRQFPLREAEIAALFSEIQAQLFDIYEAEQNALANLQI